MKDRRTIARHRVLKAGKIEFGGGSIDCTVRNLSATGAALRVESVIGIPTNFILAVPADNVKRHCQVAWRKEKELGLRFTDEIIVGK